MVLLYVKYGIVFLVMPLKLLGKQFVETLERNDLHAISMSAANATNELFKVCGLQCHNTIKLIVPAGNREGYLPAGDTFDCSDSKSNRSGKQVRIVLNSKEVTHIAATSNAEGSAQGPINPSTYTG